MRLQPSPLVLWLFALMADFGAVFGLMSREPLGLGKLFSKGERQFFPSFIIGDVFLLPTYIGLSAYVANQIPRDVSAFWNKPWFHWILLAIGLVISVYIEFAGMKSGTGFTLQQELTPSKLWHTLIFGLMFYLAMINIIPMFLSHKPRWAFVGALLSITAFLATVFYFDRNVSIDISKTH